MRIGLMLFRLGILGLLFSPGVLLEEPLKTYLAQHHEVLWYYILLYGLPLLVSFSMVGMTEPAFKEPPTMIARLIKALSALTVFWLLLWCFVWSGMGNQAHDSMDILVRFLFPLGLLGTAVGAGCYVWGWKAENEAKQNARFLVTIGWNVGFMAFLNLHLDPSMVHLKGPGIGGLLVMAGVLLILRDLDRPSAKAKR